MIMFEHWADIIVKPVYRQVSDSSLCSYASIITTPTNHFGGEVAKKNNKKKKKAKQRKKTTKQYKKKNPVIFTFLQWIVSQKWKTWRKSSNKELLETANQNRIEEVIRRRRRDGLSTHYTNQYTTVTISFTRQTLKWNPQGETKRGRPRTSGKKTRTLTSSGSQATHGTNCTLRTTSQID